MPTTLLFCNDDDMLRFEPNLDQHWPRVDKQGKPKHDWKVQVRLAMRELERRLNARRDLSERFEMGRIGIRDQETLRDPTACFALHYVFVACDTQGDETGYFARKSEQYYARAQAMLDDVSRMLDYDIDNSGTITESEKNLPFPTRLIRG